MSRAHARPRPVEWRDNLRRMPELTPNAPRRTAADDVFERLHADIIEMRLTPGTKLSEVEIARQFEVSRQPVREAFIRLHDLDLLQVRPQRATEVRRISESSILNARFVRTAVEIEVVRRACARPIDAFDKRFETNLRQQRSAIEAKRTGRFQTLDGEFHHMLCRAADCEFAYATVAATKSQISRLCLLSLTDQAELLETHEDHRSLHALVRAGREAEAVALIRLHLSRLDGVLRSVRESHPEYFEAH